MQLHHHWNVDVFLTCPIPAQINSKVKGAVRSATGAVTRVDENFLIRAAEILFGSIAKSLDAPDNSGRGRRRSGHVVTRDANVFDPVAISWSIWLTSKSAGVLSLKRLDQA